MIRFSTRRDHPSVALLGGAVAILAGMLLLVAPAVAQRPKTSKEPIVIDSAVANMDEATNIASFTSISITQGSTKITADRASATGVGTQNSHWTFTGRVTIVSESRGSLWADQATLDYRDGELAEAVASGAPVHFEQRRADLQEAQHGQAEEIAYDAKQGIVRLRGNAQLSSGRGTEITAPVFVYHVRDGKLQALSASGKPAVRITTKPIGSIVPP